MKICVSISSSLDKAAIRGSWKLWSTWSRHKSLANSKQWKKWRGASRGWSGKGQCYLQEQVGANSQLARCVECSTLRHSCEVGGAETTQPWDFRAGKALRNHSEGLPWWSTGSVAMQGTQVRSWSGKIPLAEEERSLCTITREKSICRNRRSRGPQLDTAQNKFFKKKSSRIIQLSHYRNTLELFQVWFQTTTIMWISQYRESHRFFGFPTNIKIMFELHCSLLSVQ